MLPEGMRIGATLVGGGTLATPERHPAAQHGHFDWCFAGPAGLAGCAMPS